MPDISSKLATSNASVKNMSAPSLQSRLKLSIIIFIFPFFLLAGLGFFLFQKSTNAFNHAIEDVVADVIPVTELKDKIQQTVLPFNRYLEFHESDDKNTFLQLSDEIKRSLANPIKIEQQNHSLANDIYRSAYLNWRNAHRVASKIFLGMEHEEAHQNEPHKLLKDFYLYVIETTLALDKLHLAMQDRVKVRFQKAKGIKLDVLLLTSFVFLLVYIISLGAIIFLNRSIVKPITKLENWASKFSRDQKIKPLEIHSYREFEFIATTYNKLVKLLHDDEVILERLTRKDNLTQLNNKHAFFERLLEEHSRHQRYNNRYSLMIIDVDHLSSISQNYGKQVCDLTLIQIAKILEKTIRPTDILARYESDKFLILLPEVEIHGTNITAERIRNSISEYVFKVKKFKFGVTVSIGFSMIQQNQAISDILHCLDVSLQQAKHAGRNQVQFCDPEKLKTYNFKPKYLKDMHF